MKGALFAGVNIIGDMLATTPAVREWKLSHPKDPIHYVVQDEPITRVMLKNPFVDRVYFNADPDKVRSMRGWGDFTKKHLFDVSAAFSYGAKRGLHMAQAYGVLAGVSVGSCRPVLHLTETEKLTAFPYIPAGRFIVVCPHSVSSTVENNDRGGNKLWGDSHWVEIFPILREMGYVIVSLGGANDPKFYPAGDGEVTELHGLPIRLAAAVMDRADYVVTIDSGLAHIASALDKNLIEIYPKRFPLTWVHPHTTHNQVIQGYPPDITVKTVVKALDDLIGKCEGTGKKQRKAPDAGDPADAETKADKDADAPTDIEETAE
jgi:ADP-heptose:LPS heptosyltransferase